jgi:hypothetical protein
MPSSNADVLETDAIKMIVQIVGIPAQGPFQNHPVLNDCTA